LSVNRREEDPLLIPGIHVEAFTAMDAFVRRQNAEVIARYEWPREREEFCKDDACLSFRGSLNDTAFLMYSNPNGFGGERSAGRHIAILGTVSMNRAICSSDEMFISTTSEDGSGHATFRLVSRATPDDPSGLVVNAHPKLYSGVFDLKGSIIGDLAFK